MIFIMRIRVAASSCDTSARVDHGTGLLLKMGGVCVLYKRGRRELMIFYDFVLIEFISEHEKEAVMMMMMMMMMTTTTMTMTMTMALRWQ